MGKTDKYFQFPLSALSYGMHRGERWKDVMCLASLHYGRKLLTKGSLARITEAITDYEKKHPACQDYDNSEDHEAMLIANHAGHLVLEHGVADAVNRARAAWKHCEAQPFPTVRIRSDLWWKTFLPGRCTSPLTFREFAVLCAVYAAIGAKPYVKLSLKRIQAFAAGTCNYWTFLDRQKAGCPNSLFLSIRQVRTTLNNLEANRFFSKFTYNRGECFYSNKLTRNKLVKSIENRKLRKVETLAANRIADQLSSMDISERKKLAISPYANGMYTSGLPKQNLTSVR